MSWPIAHRRNAGGWQTGLLRVLRLTAALGLLGTPVAMASLPAHGLEVEVFKGRFASVNSFVFSNGRSLAVVDVQRTAAEARRLIEIVKAKRLPLAYILISHGHTDHFTGMALFHDEFPQAQIVVCSEAIKKDIEAYALYMDRGGETGAEPALDPALRPRSWENPSGFDYEGAIHVLRRPQLSLPGGGTLELACDYPPTEAPHMTTVYSPELNALFAADLVYNGVFPWMGDDIDKQRIAAWRRVLLQLEAKYAALNPTVYPGHGDPGDLRVLDTMVKYIDDFVRVTSSAGSRREAMQRLEALYPGYKEADFFLLYSVDNHVPPTSAR